MREFAEAARTRRVDSDWVERGRTLAQMQFMLLLRQVTDDLACNGTRTATLTTQWRCPIRIQGQPAPSEGFTRHVVVIHRPHAEFCLSVLRVVEVV